MLTTTSKVLDAARARVRDRLLTRPEAPLAVHDPSAAASAVALAGILGVKIEHLRLDDRLQDILRVHRDDLPADVRAMMGKLGLREVIDPFAFDLLDLVERRFREQRARAQRLAFHPIPKNEEEWIDRILSMTVNELLTAIA